MTKISLKAGLKWYGNKVHNSVHSDIKQLHFGDTLKPMHFKQLDNTKRKSVIESHTFLKKNRVGKIKGETVAGGNKQRD